MGDQQPEPLGGLPEGVIRPPLPVDEPQRLIALKRYDLLDTPPEQAFNRITRLAAAVMGMPISLITLLDETSASGPSPATVSTFPGPRGRRRSVPTRSWTQEPMVVPDAVADERFAANPLVTGETWDPLLCRGSPGRRLEGYVLGTLCVIDHSPHPEFSEEQRRLLQDFAGLVMTEIEARSAILALRQKVQEHQETERLARRESLAGDGDLAAGGLTTGSRTDLKLLLDTLLRPPDPSPDDLPKTCGICGTGCTA